VGLTQSIKLEVIILSELNSQRTITGTDLDNNARNFSSNGYNCNNLSNIELFEYKNTLKINDCKNNNLNNSNYLGNNNKNLNCKNSLSNSNSNKNNNFSSRIYNVLPIINSIKKLIVNAQYLYSIPNSTFLMNLININNFFLNTIKCNNNINNSNNNNINNSNLAFPTKILQNNLNNNINNNIYNINFFKIANPNYIISLFLSASCMTQSRLFIQAWEIFYKMQSTLLSTEDESILIVFSIIFRQNFSVNHKNFISVKDKENSKNSLAAKLEIIKSACMFEHGHTQPFLDSLLNAINIYYSCDYTNIKKGINWSKINDYNSDKFYVQNFLSKNGKKLIEFLLFCLYDKCEILVISALKIIEYIIDYQPSIITSFFPKIIKSLLRMIYPMSKLNKDLDPKKNLVIDGIEYEDFYNFLSKNKEFDEFLQIFSNKDNYFPKDLLLKFIKVNFDNGEINKNNNYNSNINSNNTFGNNNIEAKNLSSILIKQVNYTLDTIINNIDNLCFAEVNNIFIKSNRLLIEILKYDLDNITMFNVIKLIRKIYENINSAAGEINKSINRNNKAEKQFSELISAILTISVNPKIILKDISEVCNFKKNNNLSGNVNNHCNNENSFSKFQNLSNDKFNKGSKNICNNNNNFYNSLKFFDLFENCEKSNTMTFALEKLSEINFLSSPDNINSENLNWIKFNVEIIVKYIRKNLDNFTNNNSTSISQNNSNINNNNNTNTVLNSKSSSNINNININNGNSTSNLTNTNSICNSNNNYLNLFCIFFLYTNLNLLKIFYLEREDLKFNSVFQVKFKTNIELIKPLLSLINSLIELEEFCLRIKDCFFIFEIVIEIMASLKKKFSEFFDFNFNKIFLPQLKALRIRMLEYGIFKENTYFLNKVLPFIEIENKSLEEKNETIKTLKDIFEVILLNFSNFYDEEIFMIYNQLLDKLSNDLDQDLISKIIKSIVFKYNYKGNNFKASTKKLFGLFVNNNIYFNIFKNEIINSTKTIFLNSIITESLQINKNSSSNINANFYCISNNQQIYEYLEKLELYKKFVEFLKDSLKGFEKKQHEIFENLFFFSSWTQCLYNTLNQCLNETVIFRIFFSLFFLYIL